MSFGTVKTVSQRYNDFNPRVPLNEICFMKFAVDLAMSIRLSGYLVHMIIFERTIRFGLSFVYPYISRIIRAKIFQGFFSKRQTELEFFKVFSKNLFQK